ncbi:hypothetical protein [Absidia glauca]|uniref:Peptidase A2 domain-containing protein n=1 Tax=Absidia glauca TaxID=4829 RepID=A0A168KQ60_ABSGL|nr:hypothetical protein [Absidia glauca]
MEIHQVDPDVNWKLYLTYAMAGDDVDVWFSNNLKPLDVTWLEARKLLLEKFSNKDRRIDATMELFCLKMDPAKESYTEFGLRLQHLCHEASWKDDLTTAMLCLRALPQSLKENVLVVYHSRTNKHDLPQTAEEVLKIASKLAKQKRSFHRDDEDAPTKKQRQNVRPAKTLYCSHHGAASSHATRDCRFLNSSNSFNSSNSSNSSLQGFNSYHPNNGNRTKNDSKLCYYCKKVEFTAGHFCPERKAKMENKKAFVRSVRHPADPTIDDLNQGFRDIQMQGYDNDGKTKYGLHTHSVDKDYTNKPYVFPLLLQNERTYGLLDTGAEINVYS